MNPKYLLLILPLILLLAPIPPPGKTGVYNVWSRTIYCRTESVCLHEVAHKLDHEGGWISRTKEFSLAAEVFLWVEIASDAPHPLAHKIVTMPGLFEWDGWLTKPQAELYANLLQWSGGVSENMPELLRPYYDWERAAELMKRYGVNDE